MTDNTENPITNDDAAKTTASNASNDVTKEAATNDKKTKESFFEKAEANIKNEAEKVKEKFTKNKKD